MLATRSEDKYIVEYSKKLRTVLTGPVMTFLDFVDQVPVSAGSNAAKHDVK